MASEEGEDARDHVAEVVCRVEERCNEQGSILGWCEVVDERSPVVLSKQPRWHNHPLQEVRVVEIDVELKRRDKIHKIGPCDTKFGLLGGW